MPYSTFVTTLTGVPGSNNYASFTSLDSSSKGFVDFQAVIIAGPGHHLHPLVDVHHSPKCMLPVANKPLIVHVLNWLEEAGIGNCMVLCNPRISSTLGAAIAKHCPAGTRIGIIPFIEDDDPGSGTSGRGTMAALWAAREHIKSDFLLLPCDLCTDAPLALMADMHRSRNALVTCLMLRRQQVQETQTSSKLDQSASVGVSGISNLFHGDDPALISNAGTQQIIGLDGTLVCYSKRVNHGSLVNLPLSMLSAHPHLHTRSDLQDMHCYMFSKDLFEHPVIKAQMNMTGARSVVTSSSSRGLYHFSTPAMAPFYSVKEHLIPALVKTGHVHAFIVEKRLTKTTGQTTGTLVAMSKSACYVDYCLRANTPGALIEANRIISVITAKKQADIATNTSASTSGSGQPSDKKGSKKQQQTQQQPWQQAQQYPPSAPLTNCTESLVGDNISLGDRSAIRKSTVGNHVTIGKSVKLTNCLIMDHVVIQDNCKLDSVIAGSKSTIRDMCTMRDCIIGPEYVVERETMLTGEALHFRSSD